MGVYYWLTDNHKTALKYWRMAIDEGERLGARPQLSRTYAEIARRFFELKAQTGRPSPTQIGESLDKARAMFSGLGLHQDLAELESGIGLTDDASSDLSHS